MTDYVKVENLTFAYGSDKPLINNLSFGVPHGRFLAVAGPNGVGKTTVLNLLCGLLTPHDGSIVIDGRNVGNYGVKELAKKLAIVRQELVPVFNFTVAEVVSMARAPYLSAFGFETKADKQIITEAMNLTDTTRFADAPLYRLSAGERQRVFIARAFAQTTAILLLDEPTCFLDFKHQVDVYDLLKKMQVEEHKTIITVTHDINLAAQYCDDALLLAADSGYKFGLVDEVFSQESVQKAFSTTVFAGRIDTQRFFLPLGKFARDVRPPGNKPDIQQ